MKIQNFHNRKNLLALLVLFGMALPARMLVAQVMQSGTYKMQTDSINIGGQSSSSASYQLNDSVGEVGTGNSSSGSYDLHAGYWQMQETYLAISAPADLALDPVSGIVGGGSEGTITWNVTTDNIAGYSMTIASATSPALASSHDSFADYTPAGANPDYNFSIATTSSAFAISPEGVDVATRFKDDGTTCNTGALETSGKCWDGLSTTPKELMNRASGNHPSGSNNTVRFRAEVGEDRIQTSGNYSAVITVTVTTL
jgi:hypothetical protein